MVKKKTSKKKSAVKRVPETDKKPAVETVVADADEKIPEKEEKPKEAIPEKVEEKKPADNKPLVSLQVFEKLSGKKFDQFAGFKSYAKRNSLGPLTVPAWRKAFTEFMGKPTN